MDFPFPERKGVYVLTGANGSGKTSLLIALCRLGDKWHSLILKLTPIKQEIFR